MKKKSIDNNKLDASEKELLSKLVKFPGVVQLARDEYSPHHVCIYLFELAQTFNSFYAKNKIVGSENEDLRLKLTFATSHVLKNGLYLLGIKTLERI